MEGSTGSARPALVSLARARFGGRTRINGSPLAAPFAAPKPGGYAPGSLVTPTPEPLDPPAETAPVDVRPGEALPGEHRPAEVPPAEALSAEADPLADAPADAGAGALPPAPPGNPEAPATRGDVFAVQTQVDGLRSQVDGLRSQVEEGQARLEELRALPGIVEGQKAQIAALERGLDEVRSRLARLEDRLGNWHAETGEHFAGIEAQFGWVRKKFERVWGEFRLVREEIAALRTDTMSAIAAVRKAGRKRGRALRKLNKKFEAGSEEARAFRKKTNRKFKAIQKEIARLRWLITVEVAVAVLVLMITRGL